jgi:hypothetical protein
MIDDPIFAMIATFREANDKYEIACQKAGTAEQEEECGNLGNVANSALAIALETEPTTVPGIAAKLDFLASEFLGCLVCQYNCKELTLNGNTSWTDRVEKTLRSMAAILKSHGNGRSRLK